VTEDAPPTSHPGNELLRVAEAVHAGEVSVGFRSGPTVMAKVGDKLLDIAEASQVPIESGCRMGMCGSDPVRVVEGEDNLSAMRSAERRTLERLDLGAACRALRERPRPDPQRALPRFRRACRAGTALTVGHDNRAP